MREIRLGGGHGAWVNFNLYCMKRHSRQQKFDKWEEGGKTEGLFRQRHAEQFKENTNRQRKLNRKG